MKSDATVDQPGCSSVSAIEMLSEIGFSCLLGWVLLMFFWLFMEFPPMLGGAERNLCQSFVFIGNVVGLFALNFFGKNPKFVLFSNAVIGVQTLFAIILPLVALFAFQGFGVPTFVMCLAALLAGMAGSSFIVSWLDILSRLKSDNYYRFVGIAFIGGVVLYVLAMLVSFQILVVFALAYLLFSICLLNFSSLNAEGNEVAAPLEETANHWKYSEEVVPAIVVFGVVFGVNFVFLADRGMEPFSLGLFFIAVGALCVVLWSVMKKKIVFTMFQRVLLIVAVVCSIMVPFATEPLQIVGACVLVAAWAAFKTVNYSFIVLKAGLNLQAPVFRQVPSRLLPLAVGFMVGWLMAAGITYMNGVGSDMHMWLHLALIIALVVVFVVAYPRDRHHHSAGRSDTSGSSHGSDVGSAAATAAAAASAAAAATAAASLEARCAAIAKLYQLSPRESDILVYLARGRNAMWIQEELVISPHTAKSHIYNIYRKLDIHSQQKLMSFVEDYTLD